MEEAPARIQAQGRNIDLPEDQEMESLDNL